MAMPHPGSDLITTSLIQIYGEEFNKKIPLKGTKVVIGSSVHANIRLECPNVSWEHCILTYSEDGWTIKDYFSRTGTFINGQQLFPSDSKILRCGDVIFLGPPSTFVSQAFCVEFDYKSPESQKAIEFGPQSIEEITELSDESMDIVIEKEIKGNMDSSVTSSTNFRYKRKAPSLSEQVFCTSQIPSKKTKITVGIEPGKSMDPNQVNEISNTEDDQVRDSLSWLDIKKNAGSNHGFFNTDDIYITSCCPNVLSLKRKAEYDRLKSQLASVSEELKKCKEEKETKLKEKENILKDINEENNILAEQLVKDHAELKKCEKEKENILKEKEKILTNLTIENNTLVQQLVKEQEKLKEDLENYKFIACEQEKLKYELQHSKLNAKNEVKKELLENISEDLVCIICTELFKKPSVLDCTHTFCECCINTWREKKNRCPICRKRIETVTRVLTLDNFIEKTAKTLTRESIDVQEKLTKERQESESKQKVGPQQTYPQQNSNSTNLGNQQQSNFNVAPITGVNTQLSDQPQPCVHLAHRYQNQNTQLDTTVQPSSSSPGNNSYESITAAVHSISTPPSQSVSVPPERNPQGTTQLPSYTPESLFANYVQDFFVFSQQSSMSYPDMNDNMEQPPLDLRQSVLNNTA